MNILQIRVSHNPWPNSQDTFYTIKFLHRGELHYANVVQDHTTLACYWDRGPKKPRKLCPVEVDLAVRSLH